MTTGWWSVLPVRFEWTSIVRARNARACRIRELPPGSPVVLVASAPGAIRRCRSFAAATNVNLESEYLAFPSASAPAYLVEDDPAPLRLFVKTILVAPPRSAFAKPLAAGHDRLPAHDRLRPR